MASDRDTLADLLTAHIDYFDHDHRAAVDAVLATGWRPPAREITDPDELRALPYGSIVLPKHASPWMLTTVPVGFRWVAEGIPEGWTADRLFNHFTVMGCPISVIHVPAEAAACPHDSRSGDAGGRWRCDQCGADCGPNTYPAEDGAE